MNKFYRQLLVFLTLFSYSLNSAPGGAVATVDPIATDAAILALKNGGNAFDAAVAAGLTLGVVNGYNSGIGGGCFVVARLANGKVITLNGRERAPAKAHRDMYLRNGKADTNLSQTGALAIGVPGALKAYAELSEKHGKLPFSLHLENAAKIAENGFAIPSAYAGRIRVKVRDIKRFPATAKILLDQTGAPKRAGQTLKQPDLANTYRQVAKHGTDWFYKGPFAEKTAIWMKTNGGIMTAADFAKYHTTDLDPVRTTYRGYTILGMPPPSSGGVHVAQILNMLEGYDLQKINPRSADFYHLITESMKLAFADRAHWLGDPAFAKVPKGLVDKGYARELAGRIDLKKASAVKTFGTPPRANEDVFSKHTTHFSCADSEGNWVAITATINTSFGSKVVIPGTGVFMNNEMDDFAAAPGVPNAFGLLGAEANSVAPGKRPLSSMSPTIVLKDGKPILAVGAAGGPTIITQTLLAIIHTLDYGLPVKEALAQSHFHHQWKPDSIRIEKKAGEVVLKELKQRGHQLKVYSSMGATQAVGFFNGKFQAAHDPRLAGKATVMPVSAKALARGKHLFILSGQSNMQGHRPQEAFTPAVEQALGKGNVIVVQDALGGQPIQRWWKQWKSPKGEKPAQTGDLYDRLMGKVNPAIKGQSLKSVTFIWMQGERDAKQLWGPVYAVSLKGLYDQLSKDLKRKDINFVIGRLSDFDMANKRYPHWTIVREAQVKVAESNPRFTWISTDDLNDGVNRKGKPIKNDLHYSTEGYKTLGKRFAQSALKLIKQ